MPTSTDISERALRVYHDAIVIDTHNDMFTRVLDEGFDPDARHRADEGHTDVPRLAESGITAQFMAAWVDAPYALARPDQSFARAMRYIDAIHATVERNPEALLLATDAAGITRAKLEGKVAILIGVEGGHAIEDSLDNLRELHGVEPPSGIGRMILASKVQERAMALLSPEEHAAFAGNAIALSGDAAWMSEAAAGTLSVATRKARWIVSSVSGAKGTGVWLMASRSLVRVPWSPAAGTRVPRPPGAPTSTWSRRHHVYRRRQPPVRIDERSS